MEDVDVMSNFIKMYVSREMCLHVDMWFYFKLPILCRSKNFPPPLFENWNDATDYVSM
jgi:hypothetical protein